MSRTPDNKVTVDQSDRPSLWGNWFEDSPIPMTLEDWSEVKRMVARFQSSGVVSISEHIGNHPEILAALAPAAKILDANAAAVSVYKAASKQELLEAFNAPPDLESYNPATGLSNIYVTLVERFSAGETRVELEGPDTALDGSAIYVRTTTSIGRGYENDWGRILQTVEDITRKKQAEDALREREAQLHDTIESISEGLALYDANDRLVVWNSRYGEFHKSCEDLLVPGAYWSEIQRKRAERGFFRLQSEQIGEWVARELDQRISAKNQEFPASDGRWFEFSHRPTQQGGFVSTWRDITERKELSDKLVYQASHDALTGLINRSEFERRLGRVLDTTRALGDEHALFYLDLDQFKVINDTCGHIAGDELLRQLGQLLSACVRKRDTLARLGGDEFGVLMEHCTLAQARRVADEVCRAVAEFRFLWEERVFRIGVSIGLVPIIEMSESVSNVLSAADSACYAAKDEGRNRVHVYHLDDTDLARRQREMRWVARIDQALEDERFQLWSQPIVPIMTDAGEGEDFELLLRLVDERGETILPGAFLTAAENYGLFTKLDRWAIGTALGWLSRNPKLLERLHLCFINLSGTSLTDEEFLEFVHEQLRQSKVPPQKICFEITETAAIANLSRARTFMEALKEQGCSFALDDFGSGLSSFAYLKSLPVDFVKIDGAFVKDIVDDGVNLALVRSINDVAKVMGMWTIAESVENEAILHKLREIGVDYAQGYGIGHPAPIEETIFSGPQSRERRG